jgi:HAD superfamily hydrolase (TIGR01509 family)
MDEPIQMAPGMAILFDLDGVIVHSTPMHNRAWGLYLRQHGIAPDDIKKRMHGKRNDEIVLDYFGRHLSPEEVLRHGAAKERLYRHLMAPVLEEWLVPGARDLVKRCRHLPIAVVSNAERPNIEFVLEGAGLRDCFRAVVDGAQTIHPKPAPDIYLRAAALLGTAPANCVVLEDSLAGVRAACSAGMRVIGVTTTLDQLPGTEFTVADLRDPRLSAWLASALPCNPPDRGGV